jgi:hypothetical protein
MYKLEGLYIKIRRMIMELVYIGIGIVIGAVGVMFIGVDMFSKKAADEETKVDDHSPENEGK